MTAEIRLIVARHRAALYRKFLPSFAEVNDKQNGFTKEDLDVVLRETDQMMPVSADELRLAMSVRLRAHHRRYIDAITGRRRGEPDRTDLLVAELTHGWDNYRIHRPDVRVRGAAPLLNWVEDLLGPDGVKPIEPRRAR